MGGGEIRESLDSWNNIFCFCVGRAFIVTGHGFAENAEIPVELNYLQTEAQELNLTWHLIVQLPENWFDVHVAAHSGTPPPSRSVSQPTALTFVNR